MRKFKLNCLSISVNNRVVRKEDEEVLTENDLGKYLMERYLKEGKIVEVDSKGNAKGSKKESEKEPGNPAFEDQVKEMRNVYVDQLKEFLDSQGVEYDSDENKPELYQKYVKVKEGTPVEEINGEGDEETGGESSEKE